MLFDPELIPVKLSLSIIAAKADVPFSTLTEILVMLLAFEVLQEAGLRLPSSIGQTQRVDVDLLQPGLHPGGQPGVGDPFYI